MLRVTEKANSFAMRRLLLACPLVLLALTASAQTSWVEAPVTVTLTATTSGEQTLKPGKNNTATRTVPLVTSRLGNKQILEALVANGDIPEITGWRLVAIWADWPDEAPHAGNAYRFFAHKGKGASLQTVPVPPSILALAPLAGAYGVKHTLIGNEQTIIGGTETARIYGELTVSAAGIAASPQGVLTSSGRYVRVAKESLTYFVPGAGKIAVAGLSAESADVPVHIIGGTVSFGAAKFVKATDYGMPSGTSTGSVTVSAGATLNFIGLGSVWSANTVAIKAGATLSIGSTSLALQDFTLSPDSSGNLLITNGGTLTLANDDIIVIEPGVVFHLGTLTAAQLTGAKLSVNPPPVIAD